jgi:hypothetical protein
MQTSMLMLTFEDDDDVEEEDFNPTPIFEPATQNSYAHPNTLPPPHDEAQARERLRQFQQRTTSTTTSRMMMMMTTPSVSSSSSSSSSDYVSVSNDDDQEEYLNRLANNLDQDCINLLVNMFGGSSSSAQHKRPIPSQ